MNKKQGHILIGDDVTDNIQVAMNTLKEENRYHPSLSEEGEDILYHAALMYDIGKMSISMSSCVLLNNK